jgi:MFS family permease
MARSPRDTVEAKGMARGNAALRGIRAGTIGLLVSIACFWMALYLYVPILTPYMSQSGAGYTWIGIAVAAYGIPQLTFRIGLGAWSDRLGRRKPFIAAALAVAAASSVLMALWPAPLVFVAGRFLAGVAASCWAMFSTLYASYYQREEALAALGWVAFANSLGQVMASLVGGLLAQRWGWQAPFWASVLLAGAGLAAAVAVPEQPSTPHASADSPPQAPLQLLRDSRSLRLASALGIFSQVGAFVVTFGFLPLWAYRLGISRADLGLLTMASVIPSTVASVVAGGWFGRWWTARTITAVGFALTWLTAGLTVFTRSEPVLFVLQAVFGWGRGMLSPTLMALAIEEVEASVKTTAMAVYQALYSVGMVGGPLVAGVLVQQWGLPSAFVLAAAASAAGMAASMAPDRRLSVVSEMRSHR